MMKTIYATMVATVLALATMGQGMALNIEDGRAMEALTLDANVDDAMQIAEYADAKGETLYVQGDDNKIAKLSQGMQIFAGVTTPMPKGTSLVLMSSQKDEDGEYIVMVFDGDGKFLGAEWVTEGEREAVLDYVEAGI